MNAIRLITILSLLVAPVALGCEEQSAEEPVAAAEQTGDLEAEAEQAGAEQAEAEQAESEGEAAETEQAEGEQAVPTETDPAEAAEAERVAQ